jgi:hypothetical protein
MDIYKQPLSRDEKHSIAISILIALAGYLIALFICCDVFARFGALVVCVGVYFGAKGFSLRSSKINEIGEAMWERDTKEILALFDSEKSNIPRELVGETKAQFLEKAKELKAKKSRSVYALEMRWLKVESAIIMVGTLIWAFGDYLVLELYISCSQC